MEIQEESPLPTSPLASLEEDYGHAVLHIAWDRHTETKERTLLFAFVELLPTEIPPPIDDYDPKAPRSSTRLGGESKHYIYVRHAVMTAREGLDWYLACRTGTAVLPDKDGTPLKMADLGEEPSWPTLLSASDDSDAIPFVPQWIRCPRTHHLLPLADFDLERLWSEEEKERARSWLEDRLHFDLGEYPEYWGAVHLIAPNPVYRRIDMRKDRQNSTNDTVFLQFEQRATKSVAGLHLIFRQKDTWGVTNTQQVIVKSPALQINAYKSESKDVLDPTRGFLEVENLATGFISSVSTGVSLSYKLLVRGPKSSYEVTKSGKPEVSTIGSTYNLTSARSRMSSADFARQRRSASKSHGQRWFKGQKDEARSLLRGLLNEADNSVLLIDPYFGAEELTEIMLAVGREDIPIRILSSSELKKPIASASNLEKGTQLFALLQHLRSQQRMNQFEIRVMPGARPAIHDRFLIIDKRIWLLGSSLNEFGSRGTMLLAVPEPDAVRDDLLRAWNDAEVLDAWIAQRQGRKQANGSSQ